MKIHLFIFLLICLSSHVFAGMQDNAGHYEHEVRIQTRSADVVLAGTLLIPSENHNGSVVLMITGSGDHTRNQVISGKPMFRVIANGLANAGIASLRLDDRGTASSTGPNTRESTTADRVEDMVAAMEWLMDGDIVDFNSIGVLGHSEGALIAIKMAANHKKPDFAILLAAPSVAGGEVWVSQQLEGLIAGGYDEETIDKGEKYLREAVRLSASGAGAEEMTENTERMFQLIGIDTGTEEGRANVMGFIEHMSMPWMRYFLGDDPAEDLQGLTMPVFAVYGSHDRQTTPVLNAPSLLDGLLKAGNTDFTIRLMPDQDHFFLRKPGQPVGVHAFQEMVLSRELIDEITAWIDNRQQTK